MPPVPGRAVPARANPGKYYLYSKGPLLDGKYGCAKQTPPPKSVGGDSGVSEWWCMPMLGKAYFGLVRPSSVLFNKGNARQYQITQHTSTVILQKPCTVLHHKKFTDLYGHPFLKKSFAMTQN